MKKTMDISLLELVKLLKKREFLLGLIMVLIMGGGMTYGAYMFPDSFGVHNVIAFYGNFSSILIRLCGGIFYDIALTVCKQPWTAAMLIGTIGKEILIYMIYGFAIGATAIMITCFLNTTITPFIYLIVLFWIMPSVLQLIGQKITALGKVMDYVLFCLSDQLLMYQDWSVKNIAVFIITGVAFSIAGVAVLQKKDL